MLQSEIFITIYLIKYLKNVVQDKDLFSSNPLDVNQLTSIAETCGEKPVAVRPRHHEYSDMWGFVKTRPLYLVKPPAYNTVWGFLATDSHAKGPFCAKHMRTSIGDQG